MGGNAQSIIKNRWIHHTSFLWNFDAKNMDYLKLPSKRPAYRSDRPHHDFLTTLQPFISSSQVFFEQIEQSFECSYIIQREEMEGEETVDQMIDEYNRMEIENKIQFRPRTVIEEV
jgi:lipoate-protein ligase A